MSGATIKPEDRPGWRPVKRNCHTCGWNKRSERTGYNYCMVGGDHDLYPLTVGWIESEVCRTGTDMPPPDADGCPGWKPKLGAETWPEHIKIGAWVKFAEPIEDSGVVFDGRGRVIVLQTHKGERECIIQHDDGSQARYPLSVARDVFVAEVPKPGAENTDPLLAVLRRRDEKNTDRAQVAALGDGIDGTSWDVPAMWRPEPWDAASVQSEIDRIEAELNEKAARELRATANVGWRGHLPICRGPGGIQAKRLRALVRGVRR